MFDFLPLLEHAQSSTLDSENVDKHTLAAALWLNESIAFGAGQADRQDGRRRFKRS